MNSTLTTFDGFPRDDIDVAQSAIPCSTDTHPSNIIDII